jgi:pimeloyl-ACP methyl ester carboxylesterase
MSGLHRRALLIGATTLLAAGCSTPPPPAAGATASGPTATAAPSPAPAGTLPPPIVFVHGNGDTAGLWLTTLWRFESNGWPRERLHAIDLPYPLARDDDTVAQPGRSATAEHLRHLAGEIDAVLRRTGARQVVLVGNSRGGYAIRNYVANWKDGGPGAAKVSHVVLGGTPNHGVWANAGFRPNSEFNGAGPFLTALNNQGAPGVEITPGPRWMTIRSDGNDLYAQPDGRFIGAAGSPTNVTPAGPELRGAHNVVIPGIDHRETSYGVQAFVETYRFITGQAPRTTAIVAEPGPVELDGKVSGIGLDNNPATGSAATNLPLKGATFELYAVDPATGLRIGPARVRKTLGDDGRWGPVKADPGTHFEFVVSAPGYATTHVYRGPFPRSSDIVHLRAERLADADRGAGSVIVLARPRGYFNLPRDTAVLDGQNPPPGVAAGGIASSGSARLRLPPGPKRAVVARYNDERVVGRSWPASENHLVRLELHH